MNQEYQKSARAIAFYLPQYYPVPENNQWWGEGFTEWTNVTKAKPLFFGHAQPKLPRDLGFYDLRNPETRHHQAELARYAGVEGFCYWHYWFGNGKRILDRPFNEVLKTGAPDFPFCLAWANQSWTGIWHGSPKKVLLEQTYPGADDERQHFSFLLTAFSDTRYIRVDGKPLFLIYSPDEIPDRQRLIEHFRSMANDAGMGLYIVAMTNNLDRNYDEFDAVTHHGPGDFLKSHRQSVVKRAIRLSVVAARKKGIPLPERIATPARFNFSRVVDEAFNTLPRTERYIPCVLSGWDNTPRSGINGVVFDGSTPAEFERMLRKSLSFLEGRSFDKKIVMIKAWNEWAEGNYLEPDHVVGRGFLDAVRRQILPDVG